MTSITPLSTISIIAIESVSATSDRRSAFPEGERKSDGESDGSEPVPAQRSADHDAKHLANAAQPVRQCTVALSANRSMRSVII